MHERKPWEPIPDRSQPRTEPHRPRPVADRRPASSEPIRLHVFLARAGVGSRRACESLITGGRVEVNGRRVTELGSKIVPGRDEVTLDRRPVHLELPVHLLLHKPRGFVTTVDDPEGRPTVMSLVHRPERLYPIGRLDYNTDGVLLLTNDGELANLLMHPSHGVPKTYQAKLQGTVSPESLDRLRLGVTLDDGTTTRPAEVELLTTETDTRHTWLQITIKEGKNRQIHRMAEAIDHAVLKLTRVAYAFLTVEDLRPGQWRELSAAEVRKLRALAEE